MNFFNTVQSSGLKVVQSKKTLKNDKYENAQKISDGFDAAWASILALSLYSKQEEKESSPMNKPKPLKPDQID